MTDRWRDWIIRLRALAENGLAYSENKYDLERYKELQDLTAAMLSGLSDSDPQTVRFFLDSQTGYATPKIDVRGVIFRDDQILMVKERSEGLWTLPGGWADEGFTPQQNIVREIEEETGYKSRVRRLLAVYDRTKHGHLPEFPFHIYKFFFLCDILSGEARESHEISDIAFFEINRLPPLSVSRITSAQIGRMFEMYKKNIIQCDID